MNYIDTFGWTGIFTLFGKWNILKQVGKCWSVGEIEVAISVVLQGLEGEEVTGVTAIDKSCG